MNESGLPTDAKRFLNQIVRIEIDRPLGSTHPKYNFIYPINYGYVPGVLSGDGEELDAYLLGIEEKCANYEGRCIAILQRVHEQDDKLIIVPDGLQLSDKEIIESTLFVEQYFESILIRP